MTQKTTLVIHDEVNCSLKNLDPFVRRKIVEALKFFVPYARHTPSYKLGRWDGTVAFATVGGGSYVNLLDKIIPIVEGAGYEIELEDLRPHHQFDFKHIDENVVAHAKWPAGHMLEGEPVTLRDYQVEAINRFIDNPQSIQELTTSAGKTILSATLAYLCEPHGRTIIIVPNKDLVRQTEKDYRLLGLDVGAYYGERKELGHKHTICTWQSLSVLAKKTRRQQAVDFPIDEFMKDVVCVMVDECHGIRGPELKMLLTDTFASVPIRWAFTGTVPKEDYDFYNLLLTIGPVVGKIRAIELQEKGVLAQCNIHIQQLRDDHVEFRSYDDELRFLTTDPQRIAWIADQIRALSQQGNTLVLVPRVPMGKQLSELIENSTFIHAQTKSAVRDETYAEINVTDKKTVIASFALASTGINIPRLFNVVLIEPGKSFTRVIQSIGRGLRKAKDKSDVNIFDICSTLKFSSRHLGKRVEYYREAEYPFEKQKITYR